ncbi:MULTISPECIES: hypothetical protein [Burkholderia]|uniref:hypothetical protein n=1 Tax=Burkholderia TaxID=32008 RepID=UPI0033915C74
MALRNLASATNATSIAFGRQSLASGAGGIALGQSATAVGSGALALGGATGGFGSSGGVTARIKQDRFAADR